MSQTREDLLIEKINSTMANFDKTNSLKQYNEHEEGVAKLANDMRNKSLQEKNYFIGRFNLNKDLELQKKIQNTRTQVAALKGEKLLDAIRVHGMLGLYAEPSKVKEELEKDAINIRIKNRIIKKLGLPISKESLLIEASSDPKYVRVYLPSNTLEMYLMPEEKIETSEEKTSKTKTEYLPEWKSQKKVNREMIWLFSQINLLEKKATDLNNEIKKYDPDGYQKRQEEIAALVLIARYNLEKFSSVDLFIRIKRESVTQELKNYVTVTLTEMLKTKSNEQDKTKYNMRKRS